ncbi:hypothetical protein EKG37_07715 [Robertmurraya yapensis]|uniref:Uncharacterized protein n=1 Tax=Bacillus yapensis TaxID=2492960 RepID=A0A431WFY2_9BACI|nr:hypothetical protein [Bacillus yapensis]RTR34087.1 hypothetical protein EKG37_07715 [Bacillus yapensis]TKS97405.1 hypothetical protein FAR12_07715 [Bacillus yapensis]
MFTRKNESVKAAILLSGQSLSFKLDESETMKLMQNLEEVSFDFNKMESIKLYYPDGKLKSVINPTQISRIWFS